MRPHRWQPTRLPHPWILQARTLEWVAISFSNAWKWKVKVKSLSRVRLLATPRTAAYLAPPSMGFSRQEYWSGVPLPSLMRSLVFPILLCSSISLDWSLGKAFLSLLAILWNSTFNWIYLSFSTLPFTSLLYLAVYKVSSDNHFTLLHFFYFRMVLITASSTMSGTSFHSLQAICLSDWIERQSLELSWIQGIPWIYLLVSLYNPKGFDLGHTWMVYGFPYFL